LESDALEGIEEIIWRVDSKISEVRFVSSSGKDNLKFEYDAMGNRVAKYVMDGQTSFAKHVTYYVRDASGNVMAVYEHDLETPESYHLAERHIYGSSRVGMITEKVEFEYVYGNLPTEELVPTLAIEETVNFELEYSVGKKQYELSNHLGNVLAVISDWKVPVISGASVISYTSVVVSSQDYSPFGVTLEGRSWSAGYRYGFNGMEKDNETFSGAYDFGARIYDPRIGRWMSIDNSYDRYPSYTPYNFVLNSPIVLLDGDGNDPISALIEAVTSMGIEIALQITPGILSGEDLATALKDVEWFDVISEGATTFVGSFFFSGTGLAKKIKKIEKHKSGKLLLKFISTLTADVVKGYYKGDFNTDGEFDWDKFTDEFGKIVETSAYKALISQGYSDQADKLYKKVASTNKRLQRHYEKLDRSLSKGSSQKTIDHRMNEINKTQKELVKNVRDATSRKVLDKSVDKGSEKAAETAQKKAPWRKKRKKINRNCKGYF
jgi:RHS repeat-associated protein